MKRFILLAILSIGMFSLGFYIGEIYHRNKSYSRSDSYVSHLCSCVSDQPSLQKEFLELADTINGDIEVMTRSFIAEHDLWDMDFDAVFIPTGNGSYRLRVLCSNRNDKVRGLVELYDEAVSDCTKLHDDLLVKEHGY